MAEPADGSQGSPVATRSGGPGRGGVLGYSPWARASNNDAMRSIQAVRARPDRVATSMLLMAWWW